MAARKKTEMDDLPHGVLFDILSRLPVMCLLRAAKYTCKLWYSIINDPIFHDMHFTHSLNDPPGHLYALASSKSSLYFADSPALPMRFHWNFEDNQYASFASCCGLLSYISIQDSTVHICNPITGDHVKIPPSKDGAHAWKTDIDPYSNYMAASSGFGYAPRTNKYKYVQILLEYKLQGELTTVTTFGEVFTLGDESWRKLPDLDRILEPQTAVYCNGALYWKGWFRSPHSIHHVVSFDLDTEKIRDRWVFPAGTRRKKKLLSASVYLLVLGGTVAAVISTEQGKSTPGAGIWILMDEANDVWVETCRLHECMDKSIWVNFTFSGLWMNRDMYGIETTTIPEDNFKVTNRCLLYNAESETYSALQFPLGDDVNKNVFVDDILPWFVIDHVGNLVCPSKIVTATSKQPLSEKRKFWRKYPVFPRRVRGGRDFFLLVVLFIASLSLSVFPILVLLALCGTGKWKKSPLFPEIGIASSLLPLFSLTLYVIMIPLALCGIRKLSRKYPLIPGVTRLQIFTLLMTLFTLSLVLILSYLTGYINR